MNIFSAITKKISDALHKHPKISCLILGAFAAAIIATNSFWPVLLISLVGFMLIMGRLESPWQGAWCTFIFGSCFLPLCFYWATSLMMMSGGEDPSWLIIIGLNLFLAIYCFALGYLTVRFSKPKTFSRIALFISLLSIMVVLVAL